MMGEREFGTKLYYQLSLDGLAPQDHLLRRIARAVDFAFVRRLCRPFYSHTGQPSANPVVIFKMLLFTAKPCYWGQLTVALRSLPSSKDGYPRRQLNGCRREVERRRFNMAEGTQTHCLPVR